MPQSAHPVRFVAFFYACPARPFFSTKREKGAGPGRKTCGNRPDRNAGFIFPQKEHKSCKWRAGRAVRVWGRRLVVGKKFPGLFPGGIFVGGGGFEGGVPFRWKMKGTEFGRGGVGAKKCATGHVRW